MLLQLLTSPDLSWVVSMPGREAVTPSVKSLHEQPVKLLVSARFGRRAVACCDAAGHHRCPRDEFAAEHPLLQVAARACTEPDPREGRGTCYFIFFFPASSGEAASHTEMR